MKNELAVVLKYMDDKIAETKTQLQQLEQARAALAPPRVERPHRDLSPEARKRIAAAQKKRWAAHRAQKAKAAAA